MCADDADNPKKSLIILPLVGDRVDDMVKVGFTGVVGLASSVYTSMVSSISVLLISNSSLDQVT